MKATTIKLEKNLLDQLYELIPKDQTLSKFVKDILQNEINKRKMSMAAHLYNQFLKEDAQEADSEAHWETADLLSDPVNKNSKEK